MLSVHFTCLSISFHIHFNKKTNSAHLLTDLARVQSQLGGIYVNHFFPGLRQWDSLIMSRKLIGRKHERLNSPFPWHLLIALRPALHLRCLLLLVISFFHMEKEVRRGCWQHMIRRQSTNGHISASSVPCNSFAWTISKASRLVCVFEAVWWSQETWRSLDDNILSWSDYELLGLPTGILMVALPSIWRMSSIFHMAGSLTVSWAETAAANSRTSGPRSRASGPRAVLWQVGNLYAPRRGGRIVCRWGLLDSVILSSDTPWDLSFISYTWQQLRPTTNQTWPSCFSSP